jgi:hypothetical protein
MALVVPYQVQNVSAEQADGNILLSWQGAMGATGYQIQRSTDGVNFINLAVVGVTTQYIDSLPGIGVMFYYQVAGVNSQGTSVYSAITQMVAANPSEMSLYELRLRSQQCADRVQSDFVINSEWNSFLRLAMYELYDLLIGSYEDYFAQQQVFILTNGSTQYYDLPNGVSNYLGGTFTGTTGAPAEAFYKMAGVDLAVNTSTINPAWVTLKKYNFIDRNKYVYPNSTSTIYGVYNQAYRIMGDQIDFIPVPAGSQTLRLWYVPKLPALLADTDLTTIGYSGWLRYVIVRAAKYALDKEEGSDTSKLDTEIAFLKTRIEQMASNRDTGSPDTISDTRRDGIYGGTGWGSGGGNNAGWGLLLPVLSTDYVRDYLLANSIPVAYLGLTQAVGYVSLAYLLYLNRSKFSSWVSFTRKRTTACSSFLKHIMGVVFRSTNE